MSTDMEIAQLRNELEQVIEERDALTQQLECADAFHRVVLQERDALIRCCQRLTEERDVALALSRKKTG